jgi:hypothetical protein
MKKYALLLALLATLALTGVASAAPAQGHLTGSATFDPTAGITGISVTTTISDGEQVYVVMKNDNSGDCDGDTGSGSITTVGGPTLGFTVDCAHYTGRGMVFDFHFGPPLGKYFVVFVVDASPDRVYVGTTTDGTLAMGWVNRGWNTSGAKALGNAFPQVTGVTSSLTVTA